MMGFSKSALGALPALLLLAACAESPSNPPPAAAAPPPATVPGIATPPVAANPIVPAPGSGTTMAPGAMPARMTANDIINTLGDNTVSGVATDGQPYYAWFARDGRLRFRQGSFQDRGSWRVTGDGRICSSMTQMNGGAEECYFLYRDGPTIRYSSVTGQSTGNFDVLAGNPRNL